MKRIILYIVLFFHVVSAMSSPVDAMLVDSIKGDTSGFAMSYSQKSAIIVHQDSIPLTQKEIDRLSWKPNPMRAVWLGAIVPGLGQIYNRSYWKLPIVYGGFMGCIYAITYTNNQYESYKNAYRDIYIDNQHGVVSNDPNKSYIAILPEGYTIDRMGGTTAYINRLKDWQNKNRRFRDLSIAATVIVYALTLVDAYVKA